MNVFERLESEVRSYCRCFPAVFKTARGHQLFDAQGRAWTDFFAGAGALAYGHNHPRLKQALAAYLAEDGITHSLDFHTEAKARFLERLDAVVLQPRGLRYKVQFPGPTGTNAVEAALKLARKVTRRPWVAGFTRGYHGMTLGALALTANPDKRAGAGVPLPYAVTLPFDGTLGDTQVSLAALERLLDDPSSGIDPLAAIVLETVQAEGGVNVASVAWLQGVAELCRRHGTLLIVDDIQVGCGRTGPFFSFERAGIVPDLVVLSKALSGLGLPLAVVLIRPELDIWAPGEHNGTFRGNNHAFVTAAEALAWWEDDALSREIVQKGEQIARRLGAMADSRPDLGGRVRGLGMIQGLAFEDPALAGEVSRQAFERGVLVETAGPGGCVLKLLPPLTIEPDALDAGLDVLQAVVAGLPRPK
jgi:diaminobutyrate-2-oxoglutarate transaminase